MNGSVTCNDDGLCVCKERVQGRKCHHCENGTFNLAKANQYGCTRCVCSGITNDCSSSSKYRTQVSQKGISDFSMTGFGDKLGQGTFHSHSWTNVISLLHVGVSLVNTVS